jgi:MOSC domain-containing protein YiiM
MSVNINEEQQSEYKKLCFTCAYKSHADLKVRLMYDELSQGALFRILMHGYIQQDENIMIFVDNFKQKYGIQRKNLINKSKNMRMKARQSTQEFALNPDELENIFDLIAQEHRDL